MKKISLLLISLSFYSLSLHAQILTPEPSKVSIEDYEKLIAEVKEHRKTRLLELKDFLEEAKQPGVMILDARSDSMYNAKHIKGAVHLNFSDFTQERLARLIPSADTKILIYCNNNFKDDKVFFPTKMVMPEVLNIQNLQNFQTKQLASNLETREKKEPVTLTELPPLKPITLALNIPTYINLYGYGYRNVYELSEFVSVNDYRIEFEGTAVSKK